MSGLVSIVIPTRNRPQFLRRTLAYYALADLRAPLLLADSSDEDRACSIDEITAPYRERISLTVSRFPPDTPPLKKIAECVRASGSPYVCLAGDDDYVLQSSVDRCVEFLEANHDFSVVDGTEVRIALPGPILETQHEFSVVLYRQPPLEDDRPSVRLARHFHLYWPTWYGVHRAEHLLEAMTTAASLDLDILSLELFASAISIIRGKYRSLGHLHIFRQVYHRNSTPYVWWPDLIKTDEFARAWKRMRGTAGQILAASEGLSTTDAERFFELAMIGFLTPLCPEFRYEKFSRKVDGHSPLPTRIWRALRMSQLRSSLGVRPATNLSHTATILSPSEFKRAHAKDEDIIFPVFDSILAHPDGWSAD